MNPDNIPFNVLVVGPTNSGKSQFVVDQIYGPFRGKFYYIVLISPTFAHNKTFRRLGEKDPRMFVVICDQHEVELWLKVARFLFEGTNTLIVLDDFAASKDVKGRTGELVSLAFSVRHMGISVWALTQKYTSITASFRENVAAVVLFYIPAAKTMKSIFEDPCGRAHPGGVQSPYRAVEKTKVLVPCFLAAAPFRNHDSRGKGANSPPMTVSRRGWKGAKPPDKLKKQCIPEDGCLQRRRGTGVRRCFKIAGSRTKCQRPRNCRKHGAGTRYPRHAGTAGRFWFQRARPNRPSG